MMKYINYLIIAFLFCVSLAKSQVGDNGYPFLYDKFSFGTRNTARHEYKDFSGNIIPLSKLKENINTIEIKDFNNAEIINEVSQLNNEDYTNQNIYGKAFYKEVNITDDNNRIQYDGRYYYLYKITSSEAKALQIYFKKYSLTKDSKLFFYAENGFILGEFNYKNNPDPQSKGLEFGIQPIPGNSFYIELSYPISSSDKPFLITEKIIHSFTEFYGGAYGTAGNCHKNIACEFTGNNDKSRNIKSVGLMLYPIYQSGTNTHTYSASCSGNLINNTAQNGEPYFLTAAHCIGYEAANNNINWNTELITLFNYEAKTCTSNGSDAPSTLSNNSVLGCSILTQSPSNSLDYALIKLNATAGALSQYKVCYAGWDNNPNSYIVNPTYTYGVHHPKGDTKKISFVKTIYPVSGNSGSGYPQNSLGAFLQNSWRDGIVEKGSSGSPIFNSFDRLIGSLSTGPDPNDFNCNNPDKYNDTFYTYYSRFSNNYYTMSPWLNPNGTNVQSIGPYCPNNSIQIGAPITITYPPTNPPVGTNWEEEPIDINGEKVHPANTWGKKMYLKQKYYQQLDTQFYYNKSVIPDNKNIFAISENIYQLQGYSVTPDNLNNLKLWGIYKVIDCNKIKYIKPAQVIMRNPGVPGQIGGGGYFVDILGFTEGRVHIGITSQNYFGSNNTHTTFEIQSYKIVDNELVFESYKTLFYDQQIGIATSYNDLNNNHLMLSVLQNSVYKVYSCFFNEQSAEWIVDTSNPLSFGSSSVFTKIVNDKVFILFNGQNKMNIYNLTSNSTSLTLQASLLNQFLSVPGGNYLYDPLFIFETSNNQYYIIYKNNNGIGSYELMQLNLSNGSANSFHITMPFDFKYGPYSTSTGANFILKNNKIIKLTRNFASSSGSEYANYLYVDFNKDLNGNWVKNKTNSFKWHDIAAFNNEYILSADSWYSSTPRHRLFSIREVDYLAHPYTIYDNSTIYSAAYHRPKKLDHNSFSFGIINGKQVFQNLTYGNINTFLFRALNYNQDYNSRTNNVKTIILDKRIVPFTGNKNVYIYGKYSVVMKPGFSMSSSSGIEFHAIPQQPLPVDIPLCSLTFEDMLNPKITETPNESIYLKQGLVNSKNQPHFGEIILLEDKKLNEDFADKYKIYPNPTNGILNVDLNSNNFRTIEVYSIDGKKIKSFDISFKKLVKIDLAQYPTGVYIIKLLDLKGKISSSKIIKK